MMDFLICESIDALKATTTLIQTNLLYVSARALGNNLLGDVKDDCCTCPDNGLEILKCSYVTVQSACDRRTSHCHCHTQTT